ncbi:MAG TPA: DNA repair protein RecO [Candidatus Binataceae bacterium]|nr:DNA repair protein RecO [Candidatus Binataceae bacterium]
MSAEESTPAIVLRNRDYGESDRIVTMLTRDSGKLGGIAKGAKQSRRRFERKLEVFSHVMLYFRRRPHGELVFITRAEAAELMQFALEDDLGKIALASYMLELADSLIREGTDTSEAYRILADALAAVAHSGAGVALRQAFELGLLRWAGYELDFRQCRVCGSEPDLQSTGLSFVAARGGIVCRRCRDSIHAVGAVAISAASAVALTSLSACTIDAAPATTPAGTDGTLAIARFLAGVVDRRLRSLEFLETIL